jgi:hypothetical protein
MISQVFINGRLNTSGCSKAPTMEKKKGAQFLSSKLEPYLYEL